MDELNIHAVDSRDEFRQRIELRFGLAPVIAAAPILHQRLDLGQLHALGNVIDGLFVRPAGRCNTLFQIGQLRFIDVNSIRSNRFGTGRGRAGN